MDQCYQKEAEQGSNTAAEFPGLGLHHVPSPPLSDMLLLQEPVDDGDATQMQNHIKTGYLYKIDHIHLPPRTPVQLRSIRVAMKTEMNVAVRFPSMESLRAFFNYSARETHPALDEKFVMGTAMAAKVLTRLVPDEIFSEQKSSESFWLIRSSAAADSCKETVTVTHKKGTCLSELKGNGMVRWGVRRQVKYLGRHKESDGNDVNVQNSSSSFVNGVDQESQMEIGAKCNERESIEEKNGDSDDGVIGDGGGRDEDGEEDEGDEEEEEEEEEDGDDHEENDEDEDEEEEDEEKIKEANRNLKRKRYSFRNIGVKKQKKGNHETKKQKQKQKKNQIKKKTKGRIRFKEALLKDPKDRWSAERYKLAEQNLLAVMKAKGATAEKPILRPQLRAEARKRIGDTGLLDHLLKHMAGKLAPGGEERFRRRHNPDGAMEYWLESADLVNIRRDAGVTDPYWVPPPGWKPGDSPTQDPICARELKLLKDDISQIKRELDEMVSKRRQEENQAITVKSNGCGVSQKLDDQLGSSKCDFDNASVSVEKCKEQLMAISGFVKEIEAKIGKLTPNPNEEARARKDSSLMVPTDTNIKEEKAVAKSKQLEVQALMAAREETSDLGKDQNKGQTVVAPEAAEIEKPAPGSAAEEKAAKIQRLKSGFRICKPQGTFLWPNMVKDNNNSSSINSTSSSKMMSPQVVVQVEVPTPPSVSSSTASTPPQLPYQSASLVKPLAEKRPVTVTVSKGPNYEDGADKYPVLINLNDAPINPNVMRKNGAYGPRNVTVYDQKEYDASSSPRVGNWLALSTIKSASDESTLG
ncbi:hypothetical protein CDL12_20403 [Handroanthus impetiginosus]|uniref:PTC1-like winged helix-turn-helix domain-containing protein n=1 Tax=Handroanthus impetiginosus TaxID=429701 RepID=A0A2G9GP06_9LAMI|nr:hypothetical protein CDL12_20403 [Handroanthus impetiginosus]